MFLVNPNLGHFPLALGLIQAYAESHQECALLERFRFLPILHTTFEQTAKIGEAFGPGVWLFSNYLWTIDQNLRISQHIKQHNSQNITIHGGPSAPKYVAACETFLAEKAHVDFVVRGEGEITAVELLTFIARDWPALSTSDPGLARLQGITFSHHEQGATTFVRAPERPRAKDVNVFPSPYLNGVFRGYGGNIDTAILETNRGCPYGCTFCDWGSATLQAIHKFDLERVKAEIEWMGKHEVTVVWIADANFGIFERDVEIAGFIAETKQKYGYPKEVIVNYAKNATMRIAEIVRMWRRAGLTCSGIISIQTTDEHTLDVIRRSNIKTKRYDELLTVFRDEGLPLGTELIIGLPGSTITSFKRDLQTYFDHDVDVIAYPTVLLANSPMAEPGYMEKYQVKASEDGTLISTYSYTEDELTEMKGLFQLYFVFDNASLLRYVLRYLQWDHGIDALEYMHALLRRIRQEPNYLSTITWVGEKDNPLSFDLTFTSHAAFYREMSRFTLDTYGIEPDTAFDTVFDVNEMVIPQKGRHYPITLDLAHDVVTYCGDHIKKRLVPERPLSGYMPGQLVISDPHTLSEKEFKRWWFHDTDQVFGELESLLSRNRSANPSPSSLL